MEAESRPPLRIGLLGADEATPALVRALQHSPTADVVAICDFEKGALAEAVKKTLGGSVRQSSPWESLLDSHFVDGVVVARSDAFQDQRAEQLRKLIQAGMPLLIAHPIVDSMLVYYELDMIRGDTSCLVLPYLPTRYHPAIAELADLVARQGDSHLGNVEQIIVSRGIAQATPANVVAQFARDADLVRQVAGEMTRLGALAAGAPQSDYGTLGVHMSGTLGIVARWSVDRSLQPGEAIVTLVGAQGKAILHLPHGDNPWTLDLAVGGETQRRQFDNFDPAAAALAEFQRAIAGQRPQVDLVDAARCVELAETIERSLQKSRTIDLYYEDYTEEGTFKGTMTSLGCGLLIAGLVVMGLVALAEQMGVPYLRYWPRFLLGLLGLFLVLQLLVLGARKRQSQEANEADVDPFRQH